MTELKDLSPEQQAVVETWGQGMAVMAGAGSGKTTTLVIKCAELLKRNPSAKFAAVSFTERSASDLRAKLIERLTIQTGKSEGVLSGHWVTTIHGLCATILREYPREAGFDGEETMLAEAEASLLWDRALETLWLDENLPVEIREGVDLLLARESRDSLESLLRRLRELHSFGVLGYLETSEEPSAQALSRVGRFTLDRYERLKRRRCALDFNDLERGADRALEVPAVREALQKRFDLILVDEFQDTNPLQGKIIWRLVRPDASNLCVVGDPKQSIYRFRDADVSVFEEFCRKLPVNHSLTWNFRSRPGIIDYSNELCARAFEASEMRYDALVPKREAVAEEAVVRLDVTDPAQLGAWIQSEVARGIRLHDMALLLRKIRGNEKWLKALTAAGIPIAVGSGGLFWSDPRAREMVAFLKWWDNPANSLSGAVFLRSPWIGIPDEVLDEWVKRDPTWCKPFFESEYPVAHALRELRGRAVRPGELLLALLKNDDQAKVEAELGAPLLGLWHRAEELSSRGLEFHSVVAELATCVEQGRRERDVPPPRNQGQLSVLTMHGSKGLEFPHVILVDLGKKGRGSDTPLLFWDREKGVYLGGRDAEGERDRKNAQELEWREREKQKNLAESKRVFYVALTRARERLILVCPELEKPPVTEPEVAFSQDDWRAWVECAGTAIPRLTASARGSARMEATSTAFVPSRMTAPRRVRPRHSVTEWNLLSRCERAYEWRYIRPKPVHGEIHEGFSLEERKSEGEGEISQRELGTRVHSCLERGDWAGLEALELSPVIDWAKTAPEMAPASRDGLREVWVELAFEAPVARVSGGAPEVLVGSLDRLVVEREGSHSKFSIIDFKVTKKPKSSEALLDAYQTQMELYAQGLRALDPEARQGQVEAFLVNISAGNIQVVPVPLGQVDIDALAKSASEIVAGRAGAPQPGTLCRYCEFRQVCPEASL